MCKQIQTIQKKKIPGRKITGSLFPVSHASVTLSQYEHNQYPETEAAKWTSAIILFFFIIYTSALAPGTRLRPSETLDKVFVDYSFIYLQSTQRRAVCVLHV